MPTADWPLRTIRLLGPLSAGPHFNPPPRLDLESSVDKDRHETPIRWPHDLPLPSLPPRVSSCPRRVHQATADSLSVPRLPNADMNISSRPLPEGMDLSAMGADGPHQLPFNPPPTVESAHRQALPQNSPGTSSPTDPQAPVKRRRTSTALLSNCCRTCRLRKVCLTLLMPASNATVSLRFATVQG